MDLFINAALIATSIALFCYWFRYSCLLILAAETSRNHSAEVAEANLLSFPEARPRLRTHDLTDLERIHRCLEQDFAIITYLLNHKPVTHFDPGFEEAMLTIHFRVMSACFRLTRANLRESASDALEEMWLVVAHLANELGERRAVAH